MLDIDDRLTVERRISRAEENLASLHKDIADIKASVRWVTGLVFTLNTTIIGILTKGFGVL